VVGLYNPFLRAQVRGSGPASLDGFANLTGGKMYTIVDRDGLLPSVEKINRELRSQYVLGYMPELLDHGGRWRQVKVTVRRANGEPKLHVRARRSYYVPEQ
jgi:VWFA-related protein